MSLQGFFRRLKLSNLVLLMLALSNCCNVCFKAPKNSEDTGAIYKICSQLIIKNQINVNGCPMINYSSNFIILGYSVIKITPTRGYFLEIKRKILSLSPSSPSPASHFSLQCFRCQYKNLYCWWQRFYVELVLYFVLPLEWFVIFFVVFLSVYNLFSLTILPQVSLSAIL